MSVIYKEGQYYGKEVAIDNALNATSENPVQNKVVTHVFDRKADLENGKVPVSQLPSYVDDVIEGYYNETDGKFYEDDQYTTEIVGEAGKIYVSIDTNHSYRWTGSIFTRIDQEECNESIDQTSFDNLPQSEKDNGTAYFVRDASVVRGFTVLGNRFDKANIYTNTERMVGSYKGKPLYQRTFSGTTPTTTSDTYISDEEFNYIEDCFFVNGNVDHRLPLSWYRDTNVHVSVWLDNSNDTKKFYMRVSSPFVNTAYEFTIQYTKTSDATVSIGTGNDYSTDEQIVGTWIDGKKLYQKTYNITTVAGQNTLDISGLHVDKIMLKDCFIVNSSAASGAIVPSQYYATDTDKFRLFTTSDKADMKIVTGTSATFGDTYITFLYTKTTD